MSSSILDRIEADAESFSDVTKEKGSELSQLIAAAQYQQEQITFHETQAKEAKREKLRILREQIPQLMDTMGVNRVDVGEDTVTLNTFVEAHITEEKKAEAFAFLASIGCDDIIKNDVKVTFGKGEDNKAGAFIDDCVKSGLDPSNKKYVHPMTLKAFIKERMEKGQEIDLDLFGAFTGSEAKIKRKS